MRASSSGDDSSSTSNLVAHHYQQNSNHHHQRPSLIDHILMNNNQTNNNNYYQQDRELEEVSTSVVQHYNNNGDLNFPISSSTSSSSSTNTTNNSPNHTPSPSTTNQQHIISNNSIINCEEDEEYFNRTTTNNNQSSNTSHNNIIPTNIHTTSSSAHLVGEINVHNNNNNLTSPADDQSTDEGIFQKTKRKGENILETILRYFCCVSHFSRNNTQLLESHNVSSSDYGAHSSAFIKVLKKNDHINIVNESNVSSRRRSRLSQEAVKKIKKKKRIRLMSDIDEDSDNEDQIIESEYSFWIWLKCFFGNLTFMCHPPKCCTILNILIILFIVQGIFGIISSFILLYSSGESVLKQTESIQQIQIKTYSKNEILKIVDYTNLAVETIKFEMAESDFNINNQLHWTKLFNYVASIYGNSIPIDGIFYGKSDNFYVGYNRNVQHTIRNGTAGKSQCQYFYRAHLDTIITDDSYYYENFDYVACNLSVSNTKRPWYLPYTKESDASNSIKWAPVFKSIYGDQSIAVTIPIYVNQTISQALNQTTLRYIPVDTAPSSIKVPSRLYGVVGFQLQSRALGELLKNSSGSFGEVDMVFITNPDGDLIAVNAQSGSDYFLFAKYIIQDYSERGVLHTLNTTTCQITNGVLCSLSLEKKSYSFEGEAYSVELLFATDLYSLGWGVAIASKVKSFADEVVTGGVTSVVVFVIVFIFGMIILFFTLKAISNPIQQLSIDMLKLTNLKDNKSKEQTLSIFSDIREMQIHIKAMKKGLITFSKYVPEIVVEKVMIKQDYSYGEAGLTTQNMSVLCCELNPSEIFREMKPSDLLDLLNDYFVLVCNATHNHGGLVDKFNTNALVCYFNESTFPVLNHEQNACSAALEIVNQISELIEKHSKKTSSKISIKVSVNSGDIICGLLGSNTRMNFSMIGKNYDMAINMLQMNNHYKTKVLIGQNTLRKVRENFICYFVDSLETEKISMPCSTFKCTSSGDLSKYDEEDNNGICNVYELICHKDEATELHKKIQSDLYQIESFLANQQYHYLYDKCLCVLSLEDLQSVEYLKSKYKAELNRQIL
ncbi:predicted protein [Naegleria gruberi]|uniref:Predicted protein n=1 Tax=Naegleria gruberi TaxID=5762 RepID=D2VYE3_NAEGR|nr:uncharacterized protein NAEGRDRAFT_81707 [Naegleria gruberi]EFC38193.1 predicted protein [Naegleria gruberi]|eukprot:XP_002670937.1 predicted protein [Naegleria gruberi strain NEG-M]